MAHVIAGYQIQKDASIPRRVPKWALTMFEADDGTLYAPVAMAGEPGLVIIAAVMDGTRYYHHKGHTYLDLDWLEKNYPATSEACEAIRRKVKAAKNDV